MDHEQALSFLQTLYAVAPPDLGLWFQIRCLDPRRVARPFAWSYGFTDAAAGLSAAERFNAAGRHVFVGVNPRFRPGGKNICVEGVVGLPLDYDSMDLARDAGAKLRALNLQPGLVVLSGRGAHFYLLLDRYDRRVEFAQSIGRRLCRHTGSDNVHDRSHVMRLPGTMNWKPEVGGVMAKLVACEPSSRYSLDEIVAKLDAAGVPIQVPPRRRSEPKSSRQAAACGAEPLDREDLYEDEARRQDLLFSLLPEHYQNLAEAGAPRGERSEAAAGICRMLLNAGASEDEIETFFRLRPTGIGEVVIEKGLRWLGRTLDFLQSDSSPDSDAAPPLSTVRLLEWRNRIYCKRVGLRLKVEDGPFRGEVFPSGLDLASPRARDPWRFFFMAFGEAPAPFGDVQAVRRLLGRTARAVLVRDVVGLNVTWWWPAARLTPPPSSSVCA